MSKELTQQFPNDDLKRVLARLDSIDSHLRSVDTRLTTLEEKVDRRLQETRPMWEQVAARLDGIEATIEEFRNETRQSFRTLERRLSVLSDDVIAVRADQKDVEARLGKLESGLTQ